MRRITAVVFAASLVAFLPLTEPAAGQVQSNCPVYFNRSTYQNVAGGQWVPWPNPPSAIFMSACGPWCQQWWIAGTCHPHHPRCIHCSNPPAKKPAGGQPIDLATGNTYITQTDISFPGLGGGLALSRIWNSVPSASYPAGPHMFGLGWQSTYEDRLIFQSNGEGLLFEEDGGDDETAFGFVSFGPNTFTIVTPSNKVGTLTTNVNSTNTTITNWTLVLKGGEKRVYDPTTGFLLSTADRNGNTSQLTYDTSNRLVTVTDAASRHLYFGYASTTSNLVTTVSSDAGISLSYSYDGLGRLSKVTKPDLTTISFAYDGNNRITTVTDNDGKVLESHTYDGSGRGLTSSRANGVESVKVAY